MSRQRDGARVTEGRSLSVHGAAERQWGGAAERQWGSAAGRRVAGGAVARGPPMAPQCVLVENWAKHERYTI